MIFIIMLQSKCGADLEGLKCDYGSQVCCGETYPEIKMTCISGRWEGYYVDTVCMIAGESETENKTECYRLWEFQWALSQLKDQNNRKTLMSLANNILLFDKFSTFSDHQCPTSTTPGSCICPTVVDPVCGSNNVTYSNSCQASCAPGVEVNCKVHISWYFLVPTRAQGVTVFVCPSNPNFCTHRFTYSILLESLS